MVSQPRRTATSNFGVGRREGHDASGFYARFRAPALSDDDRVAVAPDLGDGCLHGDLRRRDDLPDNSVALVVTSPPYFAGKAYEEALGEGHIPASYTEFLAMLRDVFAACVRKLEPGGRIAVNVANLGRKPYRSLSADVTGILQDDLGLLLRGEVVWQKGDGAAGNCAWGSFRSAANPVLRDLTERVVIASKGRFDRARTRVQRNAQGLPHVDSVGADEFMAATLDVWHLDAESARRVNHPAPFPVELPERLIHLYTYQGDVVLDPFMGSGSTLVAAALSGRRGVGYDTDAEYVAIARRRVAAAQAPATRSGPAGDTAQTVARVALEAAGFVDLQRDRKLRGTGATFAFAAHDQRRGSWLADLVGSFAIGRDGAPRAGPVWEALGRALVVRAAAPGTRLVLLTTRLPAPRSDLDRALRAAGPAAVFDVIALGDPAAARRLAAYAAGRQPQPLPGFWTERDLVT